jgi:hypothetical protein
MWQCAGIQLRVLNPLCPLQPVCWQLPQRTTVQPHLDCTLLIVALLCKTFTTSAVDDDVPEALFNELALTVLQQSTLCPLPLAVQPIHWAHEQVGPCWAGFAQRRLQGSHHSCCGQLPLTQMHIIVP